MALNTRLASGGCTQVYLCDRRPASNSRFPKMLLELRHLRFLDISRDFGNLTSPFDLGVALRGLSSSLQHLKLTCNGAVTCLHNRPSPAEAPIMTMFSRGKSRLWDLNSTFPFLTYLDLSDCGDKMVIKAEEPPLTLDDLAALPSGLITIKVHVYREFAPGHINMRSLPPTIEHCLFSKLVALNPRYARLKYFPPSLKTIGGSSRLSSVVHELPDSVESFQHRNWVFDLKGSNKPLPPSLTFLSCEMKANLTLPSRLRTLNVWQDRWYTFTLKADFIRSLPRTLTDLATSTGADWSSIAKAEADERKGAISRVDQNDPLPSIWPPLLQHLTFYRTRDCLHAPPGVDWSKVLPSTLKTLQISTFLTLPRLSPDTRSIWHTLPPSITFIEARVDKHHQMLELSWPNSLKTLRFNGLEADAFEYLPQSLLELTTDTSIEKKATLSRCPLTYLPSKLVSLRLHLLHPRHYHALPPSLTVFISTMDGTLKPKHAAALPRGLREWTLRGSHQGKSSVPNPWKHDTLPLTLLTLDALGGLRGLSGSCLAHLPARITRLTLSIDQDLKSKHLLAMPCEPNLTLCTVKYQGKEIRYIQQNHRPPL